MRAKDAGFIASLLGGSLDVVALIEISTSQNGTLRYALDTEARTWDGETWIATAGTFSEIKESAERELPSLQLILQNRDGVLGPIVHPGAGGEDLRGKRCTIRQASRTLLAGPTPEDLVIEWVLFINAYQWLGREAVAFDLGLFPAESVRVPDRTMQGVRCRWVQNYKGTHCGSVSDEPTCAGTVADCALRFEPGEPLRFGGFPSTADARALRVE